MVLRCVQDLRLADVCATARGAVVVRHASAAGAAVAVVSV